MYNTKGIKTKEIKEKYIVKRAYYNIIHIKGKIKVSYYLYSYFKVINNLHKIEYVPFDI